MEHRIRSSIRVIFIFCTFLLLVSESAFGQDSGLPDIPGSVEVEYFNLISVENQILKEELEINDMNRITIQQMGHMNEAFINQFSKGDPNLAKVFQDGNKNISNLSQTGRNNATDINQDGYGNVYSGTHNGDYILNTVSQDGIGNFIEQFLDANYLDLQIEQSGNGHELYQEETKPGIGYKVIQRGQVGMTIKIKQGNIYK